MEPFTLGCSLGSGAHSRPLTRPANQGPCGSTGGGRLALPAAYLQDSLVKSPCSCSGRRPPSACRGGGPEQGRAWFRPPGRLSQLQNCQALAQRSVDEYVDEELASDPSLESRMVQWYPGHIARAERQLREQLKLVDVILEVRDARIPLSTCHPQIPAWCGSKPRLLVLNRVDMISAADQQAWANHFARQNVPVFWTNGVDGNGVMKVVKAAVSLSTTINGKRKARGLKPRAVRAVAVGFPNVGKSALINRLVNKRACESAPKPGVTRQLRWVRIGGDLDLLDAPGVLPMSLTDQTAAKHLAMCNDIGEAAYVDSLVAAALLDTLCALPSAQQTQQALIQRYGMELPPDMSGESYVEALADKLFQGEKEKAGQRILKDFRSTALGKLALELPHKHQAQLKGLPQ